MLKFLKSLFGVKKESATASAPYKIEEPAVIMPVADSAVVVVAQSPDQEPSTYTPPADAQAFGDSAEGNSEVVADKPAKAKKARAPKDPAAPKKPRAKKAK